MSIATYTLKLLFDENLAARLARDLADVYPDSAHVSHHGLLGATDHAPWQYAATEGFVLVTKDDDFQRLTVLYGPPPKVVWIRLGNCSISDVERLLRVRFEHVSAFIQDPQTSFLELG